LIKALSFEVSHWGHTQAFLKGIAEGALTDIKFFAKVWNAPGVIQVFYHHFLRLLYQLIIVALTEDGNVGLRCKKI
jgi:hypothetical protein